MRPSAKEAVLRGKVGEPHLDSQPYSGHASRVSLEIYSHLALSDAQEQYEAVIDRFPV